MRKKKEIHFKNFEMSYNINSVVDVAINLYLLSWMYPSTLCSSFPNIPQGLKFNTHLSPVLQEEREVSKRQLVSPRFCDLITTTTTTTIMIIM